VTHDLTPVQADMQRRQGADRANLASREDALASELRSLRHTETVSAQISSQLAGICAQLEGLVAAAGQLVSTAGEAGADLNALSSELASLAGALDEARRIMATAPPGSSSA
jgi:ABC-type transporter Mla subunit MlaD